jgi:dTDP-4-dehydrorhamnose 3,5-epimerase
MKSNSLTYLPSVKKITLDRFDDSRGFFLETFQENGLKDLGIEDNFVQCNHSHSKKDVIRGMHFQTSPGQAKLVYVPVGTIYDVVVDMRKESPTFGEWESVMLSENNPMLLYIPVGFAHGFCVTSPLAHVFYWVSSYYDPKTEKGFFYADPEVQIQWPTLNPIVSHRDQSSPSFQETISCIG